MRQPYEECVCPLTSEEQREGVASEPTDTADSTPTFDVRTTSSLRAALSRQCDFDWVVDNILYLNIMFKK